MVKAAVLGSLAVGGLVFGSACSPFGGATDFHCQNNAQCTPDGTCQLDTGFCAFPSSACASGLVYGDHSGAYTNKCVGDDSTVDAAIDAPTMCTAGAKSCFNHAIETCNATGTGFDAGQRVPCALTCSDASGTPTCLAASNIAAADQAMCNANNMAPALAPTTGTVTFNDNNITCSPSCGGGVTTIPRTAASPNAFYCLSTINLPAGVTVAVGANVTSGITLFSSGTVTIAANISFDGGDATGVVDTMTTNDVPGAGGPGGFTGGGVAGNDMNGKPGGGPGTCGGRGGNEAGNTSNASGAGGGGGGNQALGGIGGDAISSLSISATGGAAGTATGCSTADARPLVGGAGGGGGADGACGGPTVTCGWPGGGGGGALHIVARSMISGAGMLSASGGDGFGEATQPAGGGGGGAGGMILLEAPMVSFGGALHVNGGNGGRSNAAAAGGAGASGATVTGADGTDAAAAGDSGAGGGGAGGRIRINATTGASCANASPTASCTTGTLRTMP